ncbi:MAG: TolC family protein [Gemmatimonadales bacterium]
MMWYGMVAAVLAGAAAQDTLSLPAAIELGRSRAAAATVARLGADIARVRVDQRRADLLPNVSGAGSVTRQTVNLDAFGIPVASGVTDPFTILSLQVRASQTLVDPAAFARLKATRDSVVAAGHDAVTAGALAGAAAGVAFLRAIATEEAVGAREADSTVAARLLDQARQLLDAGISTAIDLTRSEVNFTAARSALTVARNQRDRARLDLNRALNFPADTAVALASPGDLGTDGPDDPGAAVAFALEHRSELAAERERLGVLRESRQAVRAENLPSLGVNGTYTESGRKTGTLAGSYTAQLGLSVPIFDGFRRQKRSAELGLRIEAQEARLADLEGQVATETRQALLDLATARAQEVLAADRARLAERELAQAEERFRAGVAGSIETTTAQAGLVAARDAVIQARVALGIAGIAARRALGTLTAPR